MNQPSDTNSETADISAGDKAPFHREKFATMGLLRAKSIAWVEIAYDGSCDEGQIGNITADDAGNTNVSLDTPEQIASGGNTYASLAEALETFAWTIIQHYHCGFHNNDGGYGTFVIDVPNDRITLDHHDRFVDSYNTATEL